MRLTELDLRITQKGRHAMATNLVALAMQYLTPDLIGRIATALGLNPSKCPDRHRCRGAGAARRIWRRRCAIQAGRKSSSMQQKQQTGTLSSFANMIGKQGQTSLIEKGTQMLIRCLAATTRWRRRSGRQICRIGTRREQRDTWNGGADRYGHYRAAVGDAQPGRQRCCQPPQGIKNTTSCRRFPRVSVACSSNTCLLSSLA